MRYNLPARIPAFAKIASLLGEDTEGHTDESAAEMAIAAVERIRAASGIPQRLRDLGVPREQLASLGEKAFAIKRLMGTNPQQPTLEDLVGILEEAF
jgi:alcohol dehydrogenase class IV